MRTRIFVTVVLLFVVGLGLWTGPLAAQDAAAPMEPGEVVAAVYAAVEAGDVPAALDLLADEHVFVFTIMMQRPEGADATVAGEPISAPMILVLDVEDGQITDRWLYFAAE